MESTISTPKLTNFGLLFQAKEADLEFDLEENELVAKDEDEGSTSKRKRKREKQEDYEKQNEGRHKRNCMQRELKVAVDDSASAPKTSKSLKLTYLLTVSPVSIFVHLDFLETAMILFQQYDCSFKRYMILLEQSLLRVLLG
jgi:hypothetical protein